MLILFRKLTTYGVMKILIISWFILIQSNYLYSINDPLTWEKYILAGSVGEDIIFASCISEDGNYLFTGLTKDFPTKTLVIKINIYGDTLWLKKLGMPFVQTEVGLAITPTLDSGCIIGGVSEQRNLIKLNRNGDIVWSKNYDSIKTNARIIDIKRTFNNNFIIAGERYFPSRPNIYKIDNMGNLIWDTTFSGGFRGFRNILQLIDSNFAVTSDHPSSNDNSNIWKIGKDGNVIFSKIIYKYRTYLMSHYYNNNIILNTTRSISISNNNNLVFAGNYIFGQNLDSLNYIEFSLDTNTNWVKFCNFNINKGNHLIAGGYRINSNLNSTSIYKFNSAGSLIIKKTYFDTLDSLRNIYSIMEDKNYYIFAGEKYFGEDNGHGMIIKTDSLLNYKTVNIKLQQNEVKQPNINLYPNPFNNNTTLSFIINEPSVINIEIYNTIGQKIIEIYNDKLNRGSHKFDLQLNNFASGIYFLKLSGIQNQTFYKKLILIK